MKDERINLTAILLPVGNWCLVIYSGTGYALVEHIRDLL